MSIKTEEAKIIDTLSNKLMDAETLWWWVTHANSKDEAIEYLTQALATYKAEAIKYPVQGFIKDRADGYNDGYNQATEDTLQAINSLKV